MFEAQLVNCKATDVEIFSPWFPRGGDNVSVTLEVVDVDSATIEVELFTKNSEQSGDGVDTDSTNTVNISRNTLGRTSKEWAPTDNANLSILEMVRYKFIVKADGNWVLFRMLPPVWFDSVRA